VYQQPDSVLQIVEQALTAPAGLKLEGWRVERVEVLDAMTDRERQHLVGIAWPYAHQVRERTRSTYKVKRPKTSRG
jgi:hypothetical protein